VLQNNDIFCINIYQLKAYDSENLANTKKNFTRNNEQMVTFFHPTITNVYIFFQNLNCIC